MSNSPSNNNNNDDITDDKSGSSLSVGFIGAGMMAGALMDGLVSKQVVSGPSSIACSDVWAPARAKATSKGFVSTDDNQTVVAAAKDVLVIAVKPHIVVDVCRDIVAALSSSGSASSEGTDTATTTPPLIISIAAGITLETLEEHLPGQRVVRVMPNTPCLVGQAAAGYCAGRSCSTEDRALVERVFGAVGFCLEVSSEHLLNAVTGLSGSGPAYVFQFIEALSDGGVRAGLPRAVATRLAAQTVRGAAQMVLETGTHPAVLKDGVTSPGGTTIAGVQALEEGGLRAATIQAVTAATKRSMQLGGMSDEDIKNKYAL